MNPIPEVDLQYPENATASEKNDIKSSATMENYWKYVDYAKTDEGKAELEILINRVKPELHIFTTFKELVNSDIIFQPQILEILEKPDGGKPYWYDK